MLNNSKMLTKKDYIIKPVNLRIGYNMILYPIRGIKVVIRIQNSNR
jgi:hypothetical protein